MIPHVIQINKPFIKNKYEQLYKCRFENLSEYSIVIEIRDCDLNFYSELLSVKNQDIYSTNPNGNKNKNTDVIILFNNLLECKSFFDSFPKAKTIQKVLNNFIEFSVKEFDLCGNKYFYNQKLLMGILNVTPDSFSDGGKYLKIENASERVKRMIDNQVDIIDVGGESTRPGSEFISEDEELNRVIPIISKIRELNKNILVSIDTTKSEVARAAIESGANIVNDISGLTFDSKMTNVLKQYKTPIIIMHTLSTPKEMQINPNYDDVVRDVYDFLYYKIQELESIGIHNIIVDPGIGFGKTVQNNFEILNRLYEFIGLGKPIMIGVSRKSFIGNSFNLNIDERDEVTSMSECLALSNGATIFRTHNIKLGTYTKKYLTLLNNPKNTEHD